MSAAGPEEHARGLSRQTDYKALIEAAYDTILLRPSDDSGREYWIDRLESGAGRYEDFLLFLLSSDEFAGNLQRFLRTYLGTRIPLLNEYSQNGEFAILLAEMVNRSAKHRIVVD